MTNVCRGRRAAGMMLIGVFAACTSTGKGGSGETGASTGSTAGTSGPVSTGGVFTLTSATEGDPSSAGTTGTSTTTQGVETSTGASSTTGTTEGSSTGAVDACPGLVAALTAALQADARCELLLRLDGAGVVLGWHSECGPKPEMDAFDSKGALVATQCCADSGKLIGPGTSPFIYHQLPMPPSLGGVGIISNHIGAVLYDATIGLDAAGTIQTPAEWQSAEALGVGAGCDAPYMLDATSYDLTLDGPIDPPPLSPLAMNVLHGAIGATALPKALAQVSVDRVVVVGYQAQFEAEGESFVVLFEISHP